MQSRLIRNTLYFSSSRYVLLVLSLVRNLVVARALGPDEYGLWVIFMLLLTYGDQIHLGLRHAGDREIPYANGRDDVNESSLLSSTIYGGVLLLSGIGMLVATGVLVALGPTQLLSRVVFLSGIVVVSDQVSRFYLMLLRTRKEFVVSSVVEVAFEILRTVLVSGLAFLFTLFGAIVALGVASIATSAFFLVRFRGTVAPRFHWSTIRRLIPVGFPLFASGLLYILIISLDRVIGAAVLTKAELGVLGLASLLAQVPVSAAQSIKDVLYPSLSEAVGKDPNAADAFALFRKGLDLSAVVLPVLVGLVTILSAPVIILLLPEFKESIPLVAILSNGVYFLCLSALPLGLLMAVRQTRIYLSVQIVSVVVSIGLYLVFFDRIGGITSLCYAASCSFFLFASLTLSAAMKGQQDSVSTTLFRLFLPSFVSMGLVILVSSLVVVDVRSAFPEILSQSGLQLILYFTLLIPVFAFFDRRMKIRELVREVMGAHA